MSNMCPATPDPSVLGHQVIKASYMLKRAQMKRWYQTENYKNRWFVLTKDKLTYYEGNTESGYTNQKQRGSIFLCNVLVVANVDDTALDMPNTFQIEYTEDKETHTLFIIANFAGEREQWVNTLQAVCRSCGATLSEFYHPGVWQARVAQYSCCRQLLRQAKGCKTLSLIHSHHLNHARYDDDMTSEHNSPDNSTYKDTSFSHPTRLPASDRTSVSSSPDLLMGRRIVALYNYDANNEGDLSLCKGCEYTIIEDEYPHWWKVKNSSGESGYVPTNYVKITTKDGLEKYSWYWPSVSREGCEDILKGESWEGCFMVRHSSKRGRYTLSVYCIDKTHPLGGVRHYQISVDMDGNYFFSEFYKFSNIPDLISFHKYNLIGLVTRLQGPPKQTNGNGSAGIWAISERELKFGEQLGTGEFGAVYKGVWRGHATVAIKSMKSAAGNRQEFVLEAETMMQLQHPNLVKLYGVCESKGSIYIVTEYMCHGSLLQYLVKGRARVLAQPQTLLTMCVAVCNGLCYLETQGFIHRDVAARNCLVGDHMTVKLADFGLARFVLDNIYTSCTSSKMPIRWTAPEVLQTNQYSHKADVWSMGVLMWEIYSGGKPPYGRQKKNIDVYNSVVRESARLEQPLSCPRPVYEIMFSCWAQAPDNRPTFKQLLTSLEHCQDSRSAVS